MNKVIQSKRQLLKVNLSEILKEDLKVLSYIKGQTMTDTVIQLITDACTNNQADIDEIKKLRKRKTNLNRE